MILAGEPDVIGIQKLVCLVVLPSAHFWGGLVEGPDADAAVFFGEQAARAGREIHEGGRRRRGDRPEHGFSSALSGTGRGAAGSGSSRQGADGVVANADSARVCRSSGVPRQPAQPVVIASCVPSFGSTTKKGSKCPRARAPKASSQRTSITCSRFSRPDAASSVSTASVSWPVRPAGDLRVSTNRSRPTSTTLKILPAMPWLRVTVPVSGSTTSSSDVPHAAARACHRSQSGRRAPPERRLAIRRSSPRGSRQTHRVGRTPFEPHDWARLGCRRHSTASIHAMRRDSRSTTVPPNTKYLSPGTRSHSRVSNGICGTTRLTSGSAAGAHARGRSDSRPTGAGAGEDEPAERRPHNPRKGSLKAAHPPSQCARVTAR